MPSIADLGLTGSSTVADFVHLKTGDHRPVRVPAGAGHWPWRPVRRRCGAPTCSSL